MIMEALLMFILVIILMCMKYRTEKRCVIKDVKSQRPKVGAAPQPIPK